MEGKSKSHSVSINVNQYLKSEMLSWYNPSEVSSDKFGLIKPLCFVFRT